eukprot:6258576-Prymnesium_polylepis.1
MHDAFGRSTTHTEAAERCSSPQMQSAADYGAQVSSHPHLPSLAGGNPKESPLGQRPHPTP